MNRRRFLKFAATAGSSLALGNLLFPLGNASGDPDSDGGALRGIRIVDAHSHPDQFYSEKPRVTDLSSTLRSITALGMTASAFSAVGDTSVFRRGNVPEDDYWSTMTQLDRVLRLAKSGKVRLLRKYSDLEEIAAPVTAPGAILAIEGGDPLNGRTERLEEFHRMGVRMITLMHYTNNELGDIMCPYGMRQPAPPRDGLTTAGRKIVERMQGLGMIVDVAHAHPLTLEHVAEMSRKPLVDSHTSPCPLPDPPGCARTRSWKDMERVAKTGGVICTWPLANEAGGRPRRSFQDWAHEILEMKKRLGMEHVGLGTDGGGNLPRMVDGYRDVRDLVSLVSAMREAGLSRQDIQAYMGGNFLRVFKECVG